jgi:nucleoside-diphosphate-sugar epimerase
MGPLKPEYAPNMPGRNASPDGKVVAVTGASGYLAGRLIQALCDDDAIERVLGFDVRSSEFVHPKYIFDHMDVRNSAIESRLGGVDVLVHLAFIMDPIKDESLMRDVNVNGSQNVFRCAGKAGVGRIVYTSSAVVYGAHPDNQVPLTEDAPLRANLDFSYAAHKLEVEYVVREFRDEFPGAGFALLRPAIVFGSNADSAWSHLLEIPLSVGVRGYSPPLQFVHEDDVSAALKFAVDEDLDGAFNLAPADWMTGDEVIAAAGRRRLDLPEAAAFSVVERLWNLGLSEVPAAMMHYAMYPWVVSSEKLAAKGFSCAHTTRGALDALLERISGYTRIGTKRVSRGGILRGAAAGAGVLGASWVWRAVRHRRAAARW